MYSSKCFENCWLNILCKRCMLLSLFWFFREIFLDVYIFSFISKQNRLLIASDGFGVSVVYEMYSMHHNIYYLVANTSGLLPFALWVSEDMVEIALSYLLKSWNSAGFCLLQQMCASVLGIPVLQSDALYVFYVLLC